MNQLTPETPEERLERLKKERDALISLGVKNPEESIKVRKKCEEIALLIQSIDNNQCT